MGFGTGLGLSAPFTRRGNHRSRLVLRADAGSGFYGGQQVRVLRVYLAATTFLFCYGVAFTLFPIREGRAVLMHAGGITAICAGIAALIWLAVHPERPAPATAVAIVATPIVMAFHRAIIAEFVCLIGPMFLTMYLRAFHPPRRGVILVALLTVACVGALAVAPTHKLYIDYLIFAVAIVGASESFGLVLRSLVAAACTDPLTGLLNRAGWEVATADLLARSRSSDVTVTVVALDIDNLKRINDSRGHLAGDEHLIAHAESWQEIAPANAVLARLGGDEFAACIAERPGPTRGTAQRFVADLRLRTPDTSLGVAYLNGEGADIGVLCSAADRDLYAAKRQRPPATADPDLSSAL